MSFSCSTDVWSTHNSICLASFYEDQGIWMLMLYQRVSSQNILIEKDQLLPAFGPSCYEYLIPIVSTFHSFCYTS